MKSFALVVLALLSLLVGVAAYDVHLTAYTLDNPVMDYSFGYCENALESSYTVMPNTQATQTQAANLVRDNGFTMVPIGGFARWGTCLRTDCAWYFYKGVFRSNFIAFYYGVVIPSDAQMNYVTGATPRLDCGVTGDCTRDDPNVYNGFQKGVWPQYWYNTSYWGQRQTVMVADGTWQNRDMFTFFGQYLCGVYEYKNSDGVPGPGKLGNGDAFFPTYPNGDIILNISGTSREHCGKTINQDSQGRWIDQRCKDPFPWWAALVIAVAAVVVLIAIIIIIACCCCYCERRKERKAIERKLETLEDNPAEVPTQTEAGYSRTAALFDSQQNSVEEEQAQ